MGGATSGGESQGAVGKGLGFWVLGFKGFRAFVF